MSYVVLGPDDLHYAPDVPGAVLAPTNEDGQTYRYFLARPGGYDTVFADTVEDVLDALIPGYEQMTDEIDRAEARVLLAEAAAAIQQAQALSAIDPDTISDEDWSVLAAPRLGPNAPHPTLWASDIPLFVVETAYTPYTSVPRPASIHDGTQADNLWWVRPTEPEDFVLSLHEIGYIRLMESTD